MTELHSAGSARAWSPLLLTLLGFAGLGSLAGYRLLHAAPLSMQAVLGAGIAIYLALMLWESRISVREVSKPDALHDRGTMELCAVAKISLLLSVLAGGNSIIGGNLHLGIAFAGIALMVSGIWLRTAAIRTLGNSYSHRIRVPDRQLRRIGPYRTIRHPAYAGTLIIHVGVVCLCPNWFSLAALAGWFGAVWLRTCVEEEFLRRTLPEYRDYCLSVRGAWIPALPGGSFQACLPILLSISFIVLILWSSALKLTRMPLELAFALGAVVLAYLGWLMVESRLAVKEVSKDRTKIDRGTLELYAFGRAATVLCGLGFPIEWSGVGVWYPIGVLVFLGGVGLRLSAIHALGRYYSHRVRISESHKIVAEGPYRILRHPAYSGMILAHCGFVVCFLNLASAAFLLVILAPALILRIRVEEKVLFELHGYPQYARHRARLIPLLW